MRIDNGSVWVDVPETHGPRIAGFGFCGGASVFGTGAGATRDTPDGCWRAYEGHRFWVAPEQFPETYRVDAEPPAIEAGALVIAASRGADALGIETTIALELLPLGASVRVSHTARNVGRDPRLVAPWALTVMAPNGFGVLPREPYLSHDECLTPGGTLTLWPYAQLADPRITWRRDAILIRCDASADTPWKIGSSGEAGWCAYVREDTAFIKVPSYEIGALYPDRGCAVEAFTRGAFFELETLGPLKNLVPGAAATHVEHWSLLHVDGEDAVPQIQAHLGRT